MKIMDNELTILVNSTDGFWDCWYPFFKLFETYWPRCPHKIVLNTETKEYRHAGLDIVCTKTYSREFGRKLSWSECLIRCLDMIDTDAILYLQEDYFVNDYVDAGHLYQLLHIMHREKYSHIRLMELDNGGPWHQSLYPLLWEIDQRANHRISLQAGLWMKDRLKFYLNPRENAWQFERWGNRRA